MLNIIDVNEAAAFAPSLAFRDDDSAALNAALVHHLPGRLRLRSAVLKGDPQVAAKAKWRLGQIRGVTSVTANPCTGSLLLEYDPAIVAPGKLTEMLQCRGFIRPVAPQHTQAEPEWADHLASAVTGWLADVLAVQLALTLIRVVA
jgi:hypothetical protein